MTDSIRFIFFISAITGVYSLMNFYFIRKHSNVMTLRALPAIIFRLVLVTLILTPAATKVFTRNELPFWAAVTGFTGYSWMGFLALFLIIHGTADIVLLAAEKAGIEPSKNTSRMVFIATMATSAAVIAYGFHEAGAISVERIVIASPKIDAATGRVRIIQISDVHFSPMISTATAKKMRSLIKKENPDIIVSTGDLLDFAIRNRDEVAAIMNGITAPHGKFAVTGNHEFYSGIGYSTSFTEKCGFRLLRNESASACGITITGVDDPASKHEGMIPEIAESKALAGVPRDRYTILLKHQPKLISENTRYFDLQLSGHTHAGQIFPFTALSRLIFPYFCGMYLVGPETRLYVSRGIGTKGPPIRFLASPEITVIDLIRPATMQ